MDRAPTSAHSKGDPVHPVVRAFWKLLRLVGISSPEDAQAKPHTRSAGGPPSWRDAEQRRQEGQSKEGSNTS